MEHELKTWPEHYSAIENGSKTVELRLNDRPYAVGDSLLLREWEPLEVSYTGRSLRVRVTHILTGGAWLSPGYIAMSIRLMGEDGRARVQEDFRKVADAQRKEIDALKAQLQETYAHWRDARNAELLLVRNDLEETRRTNRRLLEEYHTLAGRLSQAEQECAAALCSSGALHSAARAVVADTTDAAAVEELARCVSSSAPLEDTREG